MVLFWSVSCLFSYNQLLTAHLPQLHILNPLGVSVIINAVISIYPILGWLADVHYGRYRVIIWSLRIMWVVSCIYCLLHVLLDLLKDFGTVTGDIKHKEAMYFSLYIIMSASWY